MGSNQRAGGPVLVATSIAKKYGRGQGGVRALSDLSISIEQGTLTAIIGAPGAGKSTLLQCLTGLTPVTSGSVFIDGLNITSMKERKLSRLRRDKVGFIHQSYNLVPTLTALENITLPSDIRGKKVTTRVLGAVVDAMGLSDCLSRRPSELSGAEQQQVACARALVGEYDIIVADEPTGNLDERSASWVFDLLRNAVETLGQTVVLATNDAELMERADRIVVLDKGRIQSDVEVQNDREVSEPGPSWIPLVAPVATPPPVLPVLGEVETEVVHHLSAEQVRVIDRAQKILDSLPGTVAPEVGQETAE